MSLGKAAAVAAAKPLMAAVPARNPRAGDVFSEGRYVRTRGAAPVPVMHRKNREHRTEC